MGNYYGPYSRARLGRSRLGELELDGCLPRGAGFGFRGFVSGPAVRLHADSIREDNHTTHTHTHHTQVSYVSAYIHTCIHTARQPERQTDRQTDRSTNRPLMTAPKPAL